MTSFDVVENRALAIIDDYKLRKLLNQSEADYLSLIHI